MSNDAITVDTTRVSKAVGKLVASTTDSTRDSIITPLQTIKDIGIGGSWVDGLINMIQDVFGSISNGLSSGIDSLIKSFGSAATPTPSPAPAPAPPAPTTPEVSSPGRTPGVPQAERTERPRGRP